MQSVNYSELIALAKDGSRIVFILIGSYLLWRIVRSLSDRLVGFFAAGDADRKLRAKTLVGIFKGVAKVVVLIIAALTIMETLSIPIAPLVGGIGIAGLAVSFGAQNLIRDVIGGFFIVLEDQFKVGDVIRAAGVSGQVEEMNLRITVLRDQEGVAHFIPNGEIKVVSNMAKEWAQAVLNVGVSYSQDLDQVRRTLDRVGEELRSDPTFGPNLLEPLTVLGVESLGDSQVVFRLTAKTRPLKQWETARELRRRIKLAFDRDGIEIPYPQSVVYYENRMTKKSMGDPVEEQKQ